MMIISVLIGGAFAALLIGAIARWAKVHTRTYMLHLLWGAVFLYPVAFTILDARSIYHGADARLVDDGVFGAVNAAWSAFTLLVCFALLGGMLIRARTEAVDRLVATRAMAIGMVLFLGVTGVLAALAGSMNRFLGVSLVGAVLVALLVSGEPLPALIARVRVACRALIGASLGAAVAFPGWSFVPYGHGGREFFGIGGRLIGLTPSPNYLGILAVTGLYAELAMARQNRRRASPVWVALAVVTCVWSQSRTAYLVLILLAIFFAPMGTRRAVAWSRVRFVALAGIVAMSMLLPAVFAFSSIARSETLQNLVTGRFGAWDAALEAFSDHPVTGYGSEAFGTAFWDTYGSSGGQTYANGHNTWLDILASSGVLGGAALCCFVVSILWQTIRAPLRARDVTLGAVVLVVAQMPLGTPFRLHGLSANLITMAVVLAVVVAAGDQRRRGVPVERDSEIEELT